MIAARASILCIGLLVVALSFHELISADLWLHLAAGEWILAEHAVPRVDVFSFTAAGQRWVDLHWGYQLLVALAHRLGGPTGIQILHAAAYVASFSVLLGRLHAGRVRAVALGFAALALVTGQERVLARPEAFTLLFLTLTWHVSERIAAGSRAHPAWLLVQVVWANMQGLFVLGPAFMLLRAAGAAADGRIARRRSGGAGRDRGGVARAHVAAAVAMLAVSAINPYGFEAWVLPFRLSAQVVGASVYSPLLGELLSPFEGRVVPVLFGATLALTFLSWLLDPKRSAADLLPLLGFAVLALSARRNLLLFAVVAIPPSVRAIDRLASRLPGRVATALDWAVVVTSAFMLASITLGRHYYEVRSPKRTGLGISEREVPAGATRHLGAVLEGGRVFNMLGDGDYITYNLGAEWSVAFDGRAEVYGESLGREIFAAYVDAGAFERFAAKWRIDAILMDVTGPTGRAFVAQRVREGEFVLRYLDHRAAVLTPAAVEGPRFEPPEVRDPGGVPAPRALGPLDLSVTFPFESARLGRALAALGHDEAAAAALGEAVRAFPHHANLFSDYGAALLACARSADARSAFAGALELDRNLDAAAAGLARATEALDGPAAAIAFLAPWCESRPGAGRAWITLAALRARSGDIAGAVGTLERALRRIPAAASPLARLLAASGDRARAEALLREHLRRHPADGSARSLLESLARGERGDGP